MDRRAFLGMATAAVLARGVPSSAAQAASPPPLKPAELKPMDLGLLIVPFGAPE